MATEHAPTGFFVLRTPLLPFETFLAWGRDLAAASRLPEEADRLEEALASDRESLRRRLNRIVRDPEVNEAIYIASSGLHAQIERWRENPDRKSSLNVERSLVRYLARMTGRATPFGLFAGCTVGRISQTTSLRLADRGEWRRLTQLDSELVLAVARKLLAANTTGWTRVRANSSLHRVADRWHYVEPRDDKGYRSYHLVAAEDSEPLREIVETARDGTTLDRLEAELTADEDVTKEEARAFLHELLAGGVLTLELPPITGSTPNGQLLELGRSAAPDAREPLIEACSLLDSMDREGLGLDPARYRRVERELGTLGTEGDPRTLVQVDLVKPAREATLSPGVTEEMLRIARVLQRITPSGDLLGAFRKAFLERYQSRAVPLSEALDPQSGIGFPDNVPAPSGPDSGAAGATFPLEKASKMWMDGETEWVLSDEDLKRLELPDPLPLPDAFHVHATIAARSNRDVDHGRFRIVWHGLAGPSGIHLFGRFCHAIPELTTLVREHLSAEEELRPNAIFAEVVHLPEDRVANILNRPVLRDYEIPFLGSSGAPRARQIPVSDLYLFDSGSRLVLWSADHDAEVVPRLSTAHNFISKRGVPLYRFLCAMQAHGCQCWSGWEWDLADALPALPRVRLGRTILAPARWRVDHDLQDFEAVQNWRHRHQVPRYVEMMEGDKQLLVDLEAVLSVEAMLHRLRQVSVLKVVELLPAPEELCVEGEEGRYVNEVVVPFTRGAPARPDEPARPVLDLPHRERHAPLGSEWVYLKLYCGVGVADHVLRRWWYPLLSEVARSSAFVGSYFIRYADPSPHLRIRMRMSSSEDADEVRSLVEDASAPLLPSRLVQRLQFESYEREVERYGGPEGVALAERLFFADSEAVLALLNLPGSNDAAFRELCALRGIVGYFDDLALSTADRVAMLQHLAAADKELSREWDLHYRRHRRSIDEVTGATAAPEESNGPQSIYRVRSERSASTMAEYRRLEDEGRLTSPLARITVSLTHMHVNRLLREDQRSIEHKLYYLLHKSYRSLQARGGA